MIIKKEVEFKELEGKRLIKIEMNSTKTEITFTCETGERYLMFHEQDCCESVSVEEIIGDLNSLLNVDIMKAEEKTNKGDDEDGWGTFTYTFYTIITQKGIVDIRWYGESNGYYSEEVELALLEEDETNDNIM